MLEFDLIPTHTISIFEGCATWKGQFKRDMKGVNCHKYQKILQQTRYKSELFTHFIGL